MAITVLHVDPDADEAAVLREAFGSDRDVDVESLDSVTEARAHLAGGDVDCVVTEFDLADGTGLDLVETVRERTPDTGCILYTDADPEAISGSSAGVLVEYVPKDGPAGPTRLVQLVESSTSRRSQTAYPVPDREAERLEALDRFAMDAPELRAALDRLVDRATERFDVPRASINAVHERELEFLVGEAWEPIDRENSVCTFTILEEGPTVVENLLEDPRFEGNEVIADLGIQFYAGAPIRTAAGLPIATHCVYDTRPRRFTDQDAADLQALAHEAANRLREYGRGGATDRDRPDDRPDATQGDG